MINGDIIVRGKIYILGGIFTLLPKKKKKKKKRKAYVLIGHINNQYCISIRHVHNYCVIIVYI